MKQSDRKLLTMVRKLTGYIIACSMLIWGFYSGSITISQQQTTTPVPVTRPQTSFDVSHIEQISGVVFSSPKESLIQRQKIITSAEDFLYIRMYDITYNRAKLPLVKIIQQGVSTKLILEDKKYQSFGNSFIGTRALLEDAGAQVLSDGELQLGTNFVHAKVFVSSGWSLIQTANLTDGGFNKSREYYVYTTNQKINDNLVSLFNHDRYQKTLSGNSIHPNLLVCPINCRATIKGLIASATNSIVIQNQYIQDPEILNLLYQKQQSGVTIQAIVAKNDFATGTQQKLGSSAIHILTSPYPHAKILLIDDAYLMISSINLSTNSMDNNREIGIIITNRDAISYFKDRFALDLSKTVKKAIKK